MARNFLDQYDFFGNLSDRAVMAPIDYIETESQETPFPLPETEIGRLSEVVEDDILGLQITGDIANYDQIETKHINNRILVNDNFVTDAITASKVKNSSINVTNVLNYGAVQEAHISGSLSISQFSLSDVPGSKIQNGTVDADDLPSDITNDKLANAAIVSFLAGSISVSSNIGGATVETSDIGSGEVDTSHLTNTGVSAGTYSPVNSITVDTAGRVTAIS